MFKIQLFLVLWAAIFKCILSFQFDAGFTQRSGLIQRAAGKSRTEKDNTNYDALLSKLDFDTQINENKNPRKKQKEVFQVEEQKLDEIEKQVKTTEQITKLEEQNAAILEQFSPITKDPELLPTVSPSEVAELNEEVSPIIQDTGSTDTPSEVAKFKEEVSPIIQDTGSIDTPSVPLVKKEEEPGFLDSVMKAVAAGQVGASGAFFLGGIPAVLAAARQYRMKANAAEEAQERAAKMEQERLDRARLMEELAKSREEENKRQQKEIEDYIEAFQEEEERLQRNQDAARKAAAEVVEKKRLKALEEKKKQDEAAALRARAEKQAKAEAAKTKAEAEAKARAEEQAKAEAAKAEAEAKEEMKAKKVAREVYAYGKKTGKTLPDQIRLQAAAKRAAAATAQRAKNSLPEIEIDEMAAAKLAAQAALKNLKAPTFLKRPQFREQRVFSEFEIEAPVAEEVQAIENKAPVFVERPQFREQRVFSDVEITTTKEVEEAKEINSDKVKAADYTAAPAFISRPSFRKERVYSTSTKKITEAPEQSATIIPDPMPKNETSFTLEEDVEREQRRAARREAKFSSQAIEVADALSIPKLKEFIKAQGAAEKLPSSKETKKSAYVSLAVEVASKDSWEEALALLTDAAKSQAQGFAGGSAKKGKRRKNGGKKKSEKK